MYITITIIHQNHYQNHLGDSIWAAAGTILAALSRALHVMNNLKILIAKINLIKFIITFNEILSYHLNQSNLTLAWFSPSTKSVQPEFLLTQTEALVFFNLPSLYAHVER